MKKRIIISAVLAGVLGSALLTQQTAIFSSAEKLELLSAAEAKKLALKAFNGEIVEFEFDRDRAPHYEFEIVSAKEKVELVVDAQSGAVLITERKTLTKPKQVNASPIDNKVNNAVTNIEKNVTAVENKIDATVANVQIKAEDVSQKVISTPQAVQGTGAPTPKSKTTSIISKAQAIAIAQTKASGTVVDVDYDDDDFEYEIEIKNGNTEYEFEIDARTGAIVKFETDVDEDD